MDFKAWICPLLTPRFIPQDKYVYHDGDIAYHMYFLTKGSAGFVLPLKCNIIYVEINEGDDFGQVDILACSIEEEKSIEEMMQNRNHIIRRFTVQVLSDSEVLELSMKDLIAMKKQHFNAYSSIFDIAEYKLRRLYA